MDREVFTGTQYTRPAAGLGSFTQGQQEVMDHNDSGPQMWAPQDNQDPTLRNQLTLAIQTVERKFNLQGFCCLPPPQLPCLPITVMAPTSRQYVVELMRSPCISFKPARILARGFCSFLNYFYYFGGGKLTYNFF